MLKTVLLADDDRDDRDAFEDALVIADSTMKLHQVTNGVELMDFLKAFVPDILFLDLEMPRKNGLECLVEIRANPVLKDLPVVVFSSTTRPSNIQTAYEMGAHLFFIKSALFREFIEGVTAILQMDWSTPKAIKEKYCVDGRYAAFS